MNLRKLSINGLIVIMLVSTCQIKSFGGSFDNLERDIAILALWPFIAGAGIIALAVLSTGDEPVRPPTTIIVKAREKNLDAIDDLVKNGWSINEVSWNETVLTTMIKQTDVKMVTAVLQKFSDIIIRPEDMQEALNRAYQENAQNRKNALEILELLINNKMKNGDDIIFVKEGYKRENDIGIRLMKKPKSKL